MRGRTTLVIAHRLSTIRRPPPLPPPSQPLPRGKPPSRLSVLHPSWDPGSPPAASRPPTATRKRPGSSDFCWACHSTMFCSTFCFTRLSARDTCSAVTKVGALPRTCCIYRARVPHTVRDTGRPVRPGRMASCERAPAAEIQIRRCVFVGGLGWVGAQRLDLSRFWGLKKATCWVVIEMKCTGGARRRNRGKVLRLAREGDRQRRWG